MVRSRSFSDLMMKPLCLLYIAIAGAFLQICSAQALPPTPVHTLKDEMRQPWHRPDNDGPVREIDGVRRSVALAVSLVSANQETLVLTTNAGTDPDQNVKFEIMRAGGMIYTERNARRGQEVSFSVAQWPDGAYDIRATVGDWPGKNERAFVTWYRGDSEAALKRLIDSAPKDGVRSAEQGHHAMLAEMAKDRLGGDRSRVAEILMEFEELQQQLRNGAGPVHASGFVRLAYQDDVDGSTQFCRAYLPAVYESGKKWPLVVDLHGFNGEDPPYWRWGDAAIRHVALAERHDIIYLAPYGRGNTFYRGIGDRDVLRCIELAKQRLSVDEDRVYLTGGSMGGTGTWNVASRHPGLFAAIAPVCGGEDYHVTSTEEQLAKLTPRERAAYERQSSYVQVESLLNTPMFVNHGDADPIIDVNESRYVVRMLERWGYPIQYREHPGKGHGGFGNDDEIIEWLLQHKRTPSPGHVRVRAFDLKDAAAFWLRLDQRVSERAVMSADAAVVGPNSVLLNTENVVAVTLSPTPPLVDPTQSLRISWNGGPMRTVALQDGRATLFAEGYSRAAVEKNAHVAGPLGDVMSGPFAVVVGTVSQDATLRELCSRKAQQIADFWSRRQHQPIRLFKDTDMPDSEIPKYSLILIGGADANSVTRKLASLLPVRISGGEISMAGRTFQAPDAALEMIYPHPLNPKRYVMLVASTSPAGMYFFSPLSDETEQFDFVIEDGATANSLRGRRSDQVRIAEGWFDRNWKIDETLLDRGDPDIRAKCPKLRYTPKGIVATLGGKEIPSETLNAYSGEYQFAPFTATVVRDGANLMIRIPGQPSFLLIPESENEFAVEGVSRAEIAFLKNEAGKVTGMKIRQTGESELAGSKIK